MNKSELEALAVRVEGLTGADREVDAEIERALHPDWEADDCAFDDPPAYTASLDSAITLLPEGWGWAIASDLIAPGIHVGMQRKSPFASANSEAATPALALTAASLRARAAQ